MPNAPTTTPTRTKPAPRTAPQPRENPFPVPEICPNQTDDATREV